MFWRNNDKESWYAGAMGWCPTSEALLEGTEANLMTAAKSVGEGVFVDIGPVIDSDGDRVLTFCANRTSTNTPLLLVHGFAIGSGLWCLNIDAFAEDRPIYAIDLIGFGRSSRPTFSNDPHEAEDQFVATIEAWRQVMGIEKFYLLGHSFGGYLCSLYAMKHPERVEHLILVDPWGFPERPPGYSVPFYMRPFEIGAAYVLPLFALRAAGPLGYLYLRLIPPFSTYNFHTVERAQKTTSDYFYHVNVKKPSGEKAFHSLMLGIAWAKYPMLPRLRNVREEVPITFIYGEKSWVWASTGFEAQKMRSSSYVDVQIVAGAGHAISTEQPQIFNAIVSRVLKSIDNGETPSNILTRTSHTSADIDGNLHFKLLEDPPQESNTRHTFEPISTAVSTTTFDVSTSSFACTGATTTPSGSSPECPPKKSLSRLRSSKKPTAREYNTEAKTKLISTLIYS